MNEVQITDSLYICF